MLRRFAFLCIAILCAFFAVAQQPAAAPAQAGLEEIMAELSQISGLKQVRKVDSELITREQVREYIEQQIKETVKPDEIRAEELTLKKFGFVPAAFDLKKTTIDLLSEQAAAFYDFRKKKLFMVGSNPDMLQHSALVHELAHALADQNFDLEKFIKKGSKNDDSSMARLAVMEGQATWLMSEYLTRRTGQSLKDSPVLVNMMTRAAEAGAGQFPVYGSAPLYFQQTLVFPYTKGMLFQHAVFEKLGKSAFTEVFQKPPASTQQILHPEVYLRGSKPTAPPLPGFPGERDYRVLMDGTLGELDLAILLRQYAGEEQAPSATHWKGASYKLLEAKSGSRLVLLHTSDWDTPDSAQAFFRLYQRVLKGKWKSYAPRSESEGLITGQGDDGHFMLRCDGNRVTAIEGLSAPLSAASR